MNGQPVTSLLFVLERWGLDTDERLVAALREREDNIADLLRMAGLQFGLFPQIVSEVLAESGLGTPVPAEEREMIRAQFVALMEQIAAANRGEGPFPTP